MKRIWMVAAVAAISLVMAGCPKKAPKMVEEEPAPSGQVAQPEPMMAEPEVEPMEEVPMAPEPPRMMEPAKPMLSDLRDIHFDFDKSVIRDEDKRILQANAEILKGNPGVRVMIEGHCDERGTTAYNLALGQRRAEATKRYLEALRVPSTQLATVSYGEERPLCTMQGEGCWSRNRRAHITAR